MADHERTDFKPQPRETSLLDVCGVAFDKGGENETGFELTTVEGTPGQAQERVAYTTPYGDSDVHVSIMRPTIETADFLAISEGTVDEKPKADIWVQAPRSFMFRLMNGEKYYAAVGFFRAVILGDGPYLDIFSIAFNYETDDDGQVIQATPSSVGSMLRPIPPETDWVIQEIIEPK